MLVRTLVALAIFATVSSGPLFAQSADVSTKVGDHLVLCLKGELAKQYARCTGSPQDPRPGLEIQTTATVAQTLPDGRLRIEHSASIRRDGEQLRLVTLTATVHSRRITADMLPQGTPTYASPAEFENGTQPTLTTEKVRMLRLQLSELKELKLRTWALAEEVGD